MITSIIDFKITKEYLIQLNSLENVNTTGVKLYGLLIHIKMNKIFSANCKENDELLTVM